MDEPREWIVTTPIIGTGTVYVNASNEEEAKQKALAGDWADHCKQVEIDTLEMAEECRGNVCNLLSFSGTTIEPND